MESGKMIQYIYVWDLPSGTLQPRLQWTRLQNSMVINRPASPLDGNPRYLNAETFQEEVLEHPSDHFRRPNHLYCNRKKLKIQLNGREGLLFSALPLNHDVIGFSFRGDRACILSRDGRFLLLDISGLEAYMDICNLSPPRVRCWFLSSN